MVWHILGSYNSIGLTKGAYTTVGVSGGAYRVALLPVRPDIKPTKETTQFVIKEFRGYTR